MEEQLFITGFGLRRQCMDMVWILGRHLDLLRYIGLCGLWQPEVTGCAQFYGDLEVHFGLTGLATQAMLRALA